MSAVVPGIPIIVSAPSGAGKTSLLKEAVPHMDWCETVISHTTRPIREGEREGIDYHFVPDDVFMEMVENGEFLEHANVYGNYYGTSSASVEAIVNKGQDAILEIDWQGAQQVRRLFRDHQSIFVLPPSRQSLAERLTTRAKDKLSVIENRMHQSITEMSHYVEYDYLIFNDVFEVALDDIVAIFRSIRCTQQRSVAAHHALIEDLLGKTP